MGAATLEPVIQQVLAYSKQMKPPQPDARVLLLIHGTGAATHSWRGLMPLLARHHHIVAIDLPGHAFTEMPTRWPLSLPRMAQAVRLEGPVPGRRWAAGPCGAE